MINYALAIFILLKLLLKGKQFTLNIKIPAFYSDILNAILTLF